MKARECIEFAVSLVHDKDAEGMLSAVEEELTDEQKVILKRYLSGVNSAVDTIASRYYDSEKEVRVTSDIEQRISYNALDERVYEIVWVKEMGGSKVQFYGLPFSLFVPKRNHEYVVKFKFLPAKATGLDDELEILPFVPMRAIGYLMASDICLSKNLYDEAKFWFNNFESVLNQAKTARRMRTLNIKHLL